tara:strand:- start:804 stop:1016 length:213 start_codon:yes stop_codon:yes gene_type:complete
MRDSLEDTLHVYFAETATSYYETALSLSAEHRKAAAQEALLQARYWAFKCPAESILKLENDITNLERKLY